MSIPLPSGSHEKMTIISLPHIELGSKTMENFIKNLLQNKNPRIYHPVVPQLYKSTKPLQKNAQVLPFSLIFLFFFFCINFSFPSFLPQRKIKSQNRIIIIIISNSIYHQRESLQILPLQISPLFFFTFWVTNI